MKKYDIIVYDKKTTIDVWLFSLTSTKALWTLKKKTF